MTEYALRNRILQSLRPAARKFVEAKLTTRRILSGEVLFEEGAEPAHVIFPHEGVISYMARMANGRSVEKTSVGLEGYVGFTLVMGGGRTLAQSLVQVPGHASWLSRPDMEEAVTQFECLRQAMLRYATFLIGQLMETVACNSLHTADQRIIRWLLQAHDRVAGDRFSITQQGVADVLGLRRATVSETCSRLMADGLIDYSRGHLQIIDRHGLEGLACECYGRMRQDGQP